MYVTNVPLLLISIGIRFCLIPLSKTTFLSRMKKDRLRIPWREGEHVMCILHVDVDREQAAQAES